MNDGAVLGQRRGLDQFVVPLHVKRLGRFVDQGLDEGKQVARVEARGRGRNTAGDIGVADDLDAIDVGDFAGLTPLRWAEDTMLANGFTDTDGLLAIDTANHTFAFRAPVVMTKGIDGTRVNAELIRKNRIAPAVRHDEWARAAVAAANGLETAG